VRKREADTHEAQYYERHHFGPSMATFPLAARFSRPPLSYRCDSTASESVTSVPLGTRTPGGTFSLG
jgi:hypothetical protein